VDLGGVGEEEQLGNDREAIFLKQELQISNSGLDWL
jgi:hypothetical protein